MYMAVLLMCELGAERLNASTCSVINSYFVYNTEQDCQLDIANFITYSEQFRVALDAAEVVEIKCFKFDTAESSAS